MTRLTLSLTLTDDENSGSVLWQTPYLEFDHDMSKPLPTAAIMQKLHDAIHRIEAAHD